ncbi:hypothetical protein [Psychrobacter sp. FDAARGOS_221]|uniref:hypothetical protein n=1 Tax=Psychrobacter sp. FDAARGOS_221 TaxID=1975705 RepID=UPI000BB5749C|nr:hypothetical protein [Psychrobacter sp. FDAARGOS_221]PNK61357.1 hypothetical protein A6J60_011095 [Psychrobacter sp. FDAARGOS_221]
MIILFLKTYCICEDKKVAEKIAKQMQRRINKFGKASLFKIANYWKISNYYEISFEIDSNLKIDAVSKLIANKWERHGSFYICNYEKEYCLLSDKVRWASLEYIEPAVSG